MNKAVIMGRLTRDPETRYTQTTNTMIVSFTVAVNRRFAKADDEVKADFIPVIVFGKTAEFCSKYFKKGQQVGIIGRIQTRNWDDDQGQKHYATELIGEEAYFADTNKTQDNNVPENRENSNTKTNEDNNKEFFGADDDDLLPF